MEIWYSWCGCSEASGPLYCCDWRKEGEQEVSPKPRWTFSPWCFEETGTSNLGLGRADATGASWSEAADGPESGGQT